MDVMDITRLRKINDLANSLTKNRLVSNKSEAADLASSLAGRRSEQDLKHSINKNQSITNEEDKKPESTMMQNSYTKDEVNNLLSNLSNKLQLQSSIEHSQLKNAFNDELLSILSPIKSQCKLLEQEFNAVKEEYAKMKDEYTLLNEQLTLAIDESSVEKLTVEEFTSEESIVKNEEPIVTNEEYTLQEEYKPEIIDINELEELQANTYENLIDETQESSESQLNLNEELNSNEELVNNELDQYNQEYNKVYQEQAFTQPLEQAEELQSLEQTEELQPLEQTEELQPLEQTEQLTITAEEQDIKQELTEQDIQQESMEEEIPEFNDDFIVKQNQNEEQQQKQQVVNMFVNEDTINREGDIAEEKTEVQKKLFSNNTTPKKEFHHKTGNFEPTDVSVEKVFYYGN